MNIYFHIFVTLIALRDIWSSLLLSQKIAPILMLFYFCLFTSIITFLINLKSDGIKEIISSFKKFKFQYLVLGGLTSLAFGSMMYGISFIGASLFTTIEHGLIPFFTYFLGIKLLKEHIDKYHIAGLILAVIGVQLIFIPGLENNFNNLLSSDYFLGIIIAILGSVLTAFTSIQQKKLVDQKQKSFVILFWRFLIPSILLFVYILTSSERSLEISFNILPQIFIISMVGFTLPLYFLLKGFVKSTIVSFSIFNLLIPLVTIILAVIIHPEDLKNLLNGYSMIGCLLIMLGFAISEKFFNLFKFLMDKQNEN